MPGIRRFSSAVLLLLAVSASAEVYRWVDERGVVNYGSRPPPGSKAKPVSADDSRVRVVPAPAKPAATTPASAEQTAVRDRLGRLESQVEEERRLRALAQAAEADQHARARADCEAQRRLDCEGDPYGRNQPTVIVGPVRRPIIVKPHRPPGHRPRQDALQREPSAPMRSTVPHRRQ